MLRMQPSTLVATDWEHFSEMKRIIWKQPDPNQRLVSRFTEPFNSPFGRLAVSLPLNTELPHPLNSLKSILQILLVYVYRQPWEEGKDVSETNHLSSQIPI